MSKFKMYSELSGKVGGTITRADRLEMEWDLIKSMMATRRIEVSEDLNDLFETSDYVTEKFLSSWEISVEETK